MLIYFDTEFTELGIDPKLISIGLISEDGARQFYAELRDTYQPKDCGAFVQEAVLPHLQGGDALMMFDDLAQRLGGWIRSFQQPVQMATDSLSWDWPWIQEIFHDPATWPENLDGKPVVLSLDAEVELVFRDHVPRLRRHHALDDAKANRLAWLVANEAKANGPK